MKKDIYFSKFVSLKSDSCTEPGDASMQAMNRALHFISLLSTIKDPNDEMVLPCELVKIYASKCQDNKWIAIALIVQHEWIDHSKSLEV